jgi:hypothetical protein
MDGFLVDGKEERKAKMDDDERMMACITCGLPSARDGSCAAQFPVSVWLGIGTSVVGAFGG